MVEPTLRGCPGQGRAYESIWATSAFSVSDKNQATLNLRVWDKEMVG